MRSSSEGEDGLESSPSHAKEILKNENLRLFAELVEAPGSPDVNLADDIAMVFDLMGPYPVRGHVSSQAIVCYTAS